VKCCRRIACIASGFFLEFCWCERQISGARSLKRNGEEGVFPLTPPHTGLSFVLVDPPLVSVSFHQNSTKLPAMQASRTKQHKYILQGIYRKKFIFLRFYSLVFPA